MCYTFQTRRAPCLESIANLEKQLRIMSLKRKKNIFFDQNILLINEKGKNEKILEFFVKKQNNLILLLNQIIFLNNKDSIIKWSNRLDKKNIYIFFKTFISTYHKNFNKISKLFNLSQTNNNIRKKNFKNFF